MNINKVDNTNFKAIYRLPYSEKAIAEIQQQIIPTYKIVTHQNCHFFKGRNPFFDAVKIFIKMIADNNNSSVEWLKMNAKNHGINEKSMEEEFIHVITGDKDIKIIDDYMENRNNSLFEILQQQLKQKNSIMHKIKTLFIADEKPDMGFDENTPPHLRELFYILNQDKTNTQVFNEQCPRPIDVKSTKELFIKMMNER